MSNVMNEGSKTHCKAVTTNCFTLVGLLVRLSTSIEKPKGSIVAYPSIRWNPVTLTSTNTVVSSSLFSYLFFSSTTRNKSRYWQSRGCRWSTVESEVENSAAMCGTRRITGKWMAWWVETVSLSSTSSRRGIFFAGFPVSVRKWLLRQLRASHLENSLVPINFT